MRLIFYFLRLFFSLLYHQFAWMYDLVAAAVSLGRWKKWVKSSIPYLEGRILEIGYGPGHLQVSLNEKGFSVFGLDESRQMAYQAKRRLVRDSYRINLTRGHSQFLPFQPHFFNSLVATFPAEYIYDQHTLQEAQRVLVPGGRLVIVPMAWITGTRPLERLAAWLFRITGEAPGKPKPIPAAIRDQFARAGFQVRSEIVKMEGSQVLIIIATSRVSP